MKKRDIILIVSILLAAAALFLVFKLTGPKASEEEDAGYVSITVNGRKVSGHPYKDGKVTMVPLRSIVEALGYSYRLDSNLHCSIFSAKNIDTHIFYGKNSYPVDNKYVQLERPATVKSNTLYVPLSYITDALKCTVKTSSNGSLTIRR